MCNIKHGLFILFLFSTACTNDSSGYIDIAWDVDVCEKCQMLISDQRFAVQVRGSPKNKVFLFDDFGCATHWLHDQPWQAKELWTMDFQNLTWIDAHTAHYVSHQKTPMDYGFGATAIATENSLDFETAKKQILSTPAHRRQKTNSLNLK